MLSVAPAPLGDPLGPTITHGDGRGLVALQQPDEPRDEHRILEDDALCIRGRSHVPTVGDHARRVEQGFASHRIISGRLIGLARRESGGLGRDRTSDRRIMSPLLSPLSYEPLLAT